MSLELSEVRREVFSRSLTLFEAPSLEKFLLSKTSMPSSFAMAPKSAAAATTTAAAVASRRRAPPAAPLTTTKAANGRRRGGVKANVARVNGGGETATAASPASASSGDEAAAGADPSLRSGMGNQIPSPCEFAKIMWRRGGREESECRTKLLFLRPAFSASTSHPPKKTQPRPQPQPTASNRTRRRVRRPSTATGPADLPPPSLPPPPPPSSAAAAAAPLSVVRHAAVSRVTKETSVDVAITIDGTGACQSRSSIPFLDHMMDQLASHGLFDVAVKASGDTWIDDHHTNEDVALALGTALARALGDRRGIVRFGDFAAPLDEALVHVVLDLSGRPHLSCNLKLPTERIGTYETQLVEHFFQSVVNTSGMTLHIRQLAGTNSHHIVEATFKAFARALRQACERDPRRGGSVASSKGVLTQA